MNPLNGTDIALLAIAAYVAVTLLIRLMRQRRDQLVTELQEQINAERERKKALQRLMRQRQRQKLPTENPPP